MLEPFSIGFYFASEAAIHAVNVINDGVESLQLEFATGKIPCAVGSAAVRIPSREYWEVIADNLSNAGCA